MLPTFHPRKPFRFRHAPPSPPSPPAPPAPAVVHVRVENSGDDGRFGWIFDRPFDDAGSGGWTAADFAMLLVNGAAPIAMDEVIGDEGNLTLIYPFDTAGAYQMLAQPPLLVFDVMPVAITPTAGPVE